MLRQLVVNADDLGLTVGVNDGIFDAHELGILTSASLFANAPATEDAIRRARSRASLGVGVHLTLVDGTPTLPPRSIPTLVTGDGRFRHSWRPFIAACLQHRVSLDEVERELTAQIERIRGAGISPTHLDAHKHVHAYPPVFAIVARLAARFGIPVVRVPYERSSLSSALGRESVQPATTRRQAWLNAALWPWAQRNYGVTELMVHPGYVDEALRRMSTRLVDSRLEEVALLSSMETRALLVGERIQLVRHDLARAARRSLRHVS